MSNALSPVITSRIEKAAVDNGFDQELPREGDWLGFASTQCPLRVWLGTFGDAVFLAAFSQQSVARALGELGTPMAAPLPKGALGGRTVTDIPALHRLLRRAFQLSRTLPDELLHTFEKQTAALPRTTEVERLVVQRVGQDIFRQGLIDFWEGRCAITDLAVQQLLRASHIKPWADCASDAERLDVFNGVLLAAHLDAAFDCGFITLADDGAIVVAAALDEAARRVLALDKPLRVRGLAEGHRAYLPWHREHVFRGALTVPSEDGSR
jgi:putative restriction endonuclease